jgi:hypothetical protein
MRLSKDELRKIHEINISNLPEDPSVFRRRNFHKSALLFCDKWLVPLQFVFAFIGLTVIFFPLLFNSWRNLIEEIPVFSKIFHDYSGLSGLALINTYLFFFMFFVKNYFYKNNLNLSKISYGDIYLMEIYPRIKKEELSFWIDIFINIFGATVWLIFPFGVLSYIIRMGI